MKFYLKNPPNNNIAYEKLFTPYGFYGPGGSFTCIRVHVERSIDGGRSWEMVGPVNPEAEIGAIQPTLMTHPDGRQLLVYNHSTRKQEGMGHKGQGIQIVAMSDNGIDWEAALILEYMDEPGKQFSYPSVIQTRDGLVYITWHRERIRHFVLDPELLTSTPMPGGRWPEKGPFSLETFK